MVHKLIYNHRKSEVIEHRGNVAQVDKRATRYLRISTRIGFVYPLLYNLWT